MIYSVLSSSPPLIHQQSSRNTHSPIAMAGVLETLIIPRVSAPPSASLPPLASLRFSEFRGLKMLPTRSSAKLRTARSPSRGSSRIVCEAQDTAVGVAAVTDPDWQSLVLESDLPVLVEFWAPWCGPCRMIHPVIDKLAKDYSGKLKCFKVNTDDCSTIATQYGIRSIPTVIIFKNGEKKEAVIGAVPESTLTTCIEKYL